MFRKLNVRYYVKNTFSKSIAQLLFCISLCGSFSCFCKATGVGHGNLQFINSNITVLSMTISIFIWRWCQVSALFPPCYYVFNICNPCKINATLVTSLVDTKVLILTLCQTDSAKWFRKHMGIPIVDRLVIYILFL